NTAPYSNDTENCGNTHAGLFTNVTTGPENIIPLACMDATAVDLLQLIPTPAKGGSIVQTVPVQPERGDQFTVKIDHRINNSQNLSIYYYFDDHHLVSPFAQFQAAGANIPGFGSATGERFQ